MDAAVYKKVQEVKTKVDTNLDATVSTRATQTTVNTINTNVGSNADASSATGSVHAKLKDLKTNLTSKSAIKSIQRGTHEGAISNITISISTVDPAKCMVLLTPSVTYDGSSSGGTPYNETHTPSLVSISTNNFVTTPSRAHRYSDVNRARPFSWQVIEFV